MSISWPSWVLLPNYLHPNHLGILNMHPFWTQSILNCKQGRETCKSLQSPWHQMNRSSVSWQSIPRMARGTCQDSKMVKSTNKICSIFQYINALGPNLFPDSWLAALGFVHSISILARGQILSLLPILATFLALKAISWKSMLKDRLGDY